MTTSVLGGAIRHLDRILQKSLALVVISALAIMVAVVLFLIIARYVFGLGFFWGEELSRYLMIYMAFLGGAVALRSNQHPRLTLFVDMLPDAIARFIGALMNLLLAMTLIVLLWQGIDIAVNDGRMKTPALRIPYFWVFIAVPIGAAAMLVQLVFMRFMPTILEIDEAQDVKEVIE